MTFFNNIDKIILNKKKKAKLTQFKLKNAAHTFEVVCFRAATWCPFQPELEKQKQSTAKKIPYISGNETF